MDSWEKKLVPFGLSLAQQRQQWIQDVITWPDGHFQHWQFDKELDGPWWWRNRNRLPTGTYFQQIPTRGHEREPAEWVLNDEQLRAYLTWRFPKLHTSPRKRRYAARLCTLLYLWYRVGLSAEEIGSILKMQAVCVQAKITLERRLAKEWSETVGAA